MKKSATYLLLTVCTLTAIFFSSCRDTGDDLLSFGQNDTQAFDLTDISYAAQFKAFWLAMNENYCIWDYEEKMGINWDEVYTTYLPLFEELDDTTRNKTVTDEEFRAMYSQFLDSLHDGHSSYSLKNLQTGNYVSFSPCEDRNMRERPERFFPELRNVTTLDAYSTDAVDANYRVLDYQKASGISILQVLLDSTMQQLIRGVDAYMAAVEAAGGPNEFNDSICSVLPKLRNNAVTILGVLTRPYSELSATMPSLCSQYNTMRKSFFHVASQIGVVMPEIEPELMNDGLGFICFALFPGNIAYIRLGGFALSRHLRPEAISTDTASMYYAYQMAVNRTWRSWFDAIQAHYAAGDLGGVIIDVRNNGGGIVPDYQYIVGALLPSGGYNLTTLRVKNGSGRLDFAPLMPFVASTYPEPHAVITEQPIVVLANSNSGSLAENSTWGVISQPNGYFIGTRTFGALSALAPDPEDYSGTYSGAFGVENVTSFYGHLPKYVLLYGDELECRESIGFVPNEDLPLDIVLWQTQARDNQLERALDYIHSK